MFLLKKMGFFVYVKDKKVVLMEIRLRDKTSYTRAMVVSKVANCNGQGQYI
jgi:hypothetical protein